MLSPDIISEITENKIELTKDQMIRIHQEVTLIPKYDLGVLSEKLYDSIIENADHKLKNHLLGRTIFHLYNLERLNTYVGIEKLVFAAIIVDPELLYKNLEEIDEDTFEIAASIRRIIGS